MLTVEGLNQLKSEQEKDQEIQKLKHDKKEFEIINGIVYQLKGNLKRIFYS